MTIFHFIRLLFVLLCICFIVSLYSVKSDVITKCCPIGWNLLITENSLPFCETAFRENQSTLDAYNVEYVNHPSIPQCQYFVRQLFENNEKFTQINGCVDRTANGDSFAVSCDNKPVIEVHELNRCCASGSFYDYSERRCSSNIESNLNFQRFFNNEVILFNTHVPDCGPNEVFVEYISTKHEIKFFNHDLYIFDEILEPKSFCVEGLSKVSPDEMIADHLIVRSCRPKTICDRIPCIQRCCKTDQVITPTECLAHPEKADFFPIYDGKGLPIIITDDQHSFVREFGVLHSLKCKVGRSPLDPSDEYLFHKNGSLIVGSSKWDRHEFCIENALLSPDYIELTVFLCLGYENQSQEKFKYYPYGLTVSCFFLAITLFVYLAVPKLLNIHGITLVCYVVSFLAAYIILAYLQFEFHSNELGPMCYQIAPVLLFCLLAQFCWQTVMCADIWLTFGTLQSIHTLRHNKRINRKLLYYSAYAWGFPFVWTMFTVFASNYKPFSDGWNPTYGVASCFFSSAIQKKEYILYFLLPSGLHISINCILFLMTAIYCTRVKGEIHRMQANIDESSASKKRRKFIASKAIFIINLKLFTVMGISWILEIMSTFVENLLFETIQDLYNIFLGVAIFVIFVFKRRVYRELKSRIGIKTRVRETETPRSTSTSNAIAARSMHDLSLLGASAVHANKANPKGS